MIKLYAAFVNGARISDWYIDPNKAYSEGIDKKGWLLGGPVIICDQEGNQF